MAEEIRNNQPQAAEEVNIGDILRVRREKLAALREAGADPFQITKYPQDTYSAEIKERFADLEAEAETDKERKLQLWMEAEKLFEGDFLKKLSSEIWVVPVSAYYHRLYLEIVSGILSQLEEKGLYEELCTVAKKAVVF